MEQTYFTKYISILYRQGNRFYDRELAKYNIGYGQQFYLPRIYENQGLSMYELARLGHFDKGTVTKAVQKLMSFYGRFCKVANLSHNCKGRAGDPNAVPCAPPMA